MRAHRQYVELSGGSNNSSSSSNNNNGGKKRANKKTAVGAGGLMGDEDTEENDPPGAFSRHLLSIHLSLTMNSLFLFLLVCFVVFILLLVLSAFESLCASHLLFLGIHFLVSEFSRSLTHSHIRTYIYTYI